MTAAQLLVCLQSTRLGHCSLARLLAVQLSIVTRVKLVPESVSA